MSELPSWLIDKDPPLTKYPRLEFDNLKAQNQRSSDCAFRDTKESTEDGFTRDLAIFKIVAPLFNDIPRSTFKHVAILKVNLQAQNQSAEPASLPEDVASDKLDIFGKKAAPPKKVQKQSNEHSAGSRRQSTTEEPSREETSDVRPNAPLVDSAIAEAEEKIAREIEGFHEKSRRGYREKRFLAITKCKELSNYCICCGFSPPNRIHPIFRYAGLCSFCEILLKKLPEVIDPRDGYHANCTICCRQGLNLCMCDSGPDKCIKSYCFKCLDLFLGTGGAQKITSLKQWNCILCTQENLGLLQVRSQWKYSYDKFMTNGAKINYKFLTAVSNSDSNSSKSSTQGDPCPNNVAQHHESCSHLNSKANNREEPIHVRIAARDSACTTTATPKVLEHVAEVESRDSSRTLDNSPDDVRERRGRMFSVFCDDDDDVTLADLGFGRQNVALQKENMLPPEQHSPAGSDIANNNCLPAACDQNLPLCKSITTAAAAASTPFALNDNREHSNLVSPVNIKPKSRSRVDISSGPLDYCASKKHSAGGTPASKTRAPTQNAIPFSPSPLTTRSRSKRFDGCTSSYHLKKLCLCCTSKNVAVPHPIFVGGVCEDCLPKVTKNLISILESAPAVSVINNELEEDVMQLDLDYLRSICCICCSSPKKLLRCTQPNCLYSYCEQCISGLVSTELFDNLYTLSLTKAALDSSRLSGGGKTAPGWSCYLCCDSQYQGLLKLQI